jgi:HSP20 family protein
MADRTPEVERMIYLRREAEKIVRELFQPDGAAIEDGAVRLAADLSSEGDRYVWEVELPGVKVEALKVYVFGDSVIVEGRKEVASPGPRRPVYERAERAYGPFRRVLSWPGPADLSRVTAALTRGVLTITVPHIKDRRSRRARTVRVVVEE